MNTVKIIIMSLVWKVRSTTQNACWKVILKLPRQEWIWFTIEKRKKKERKRKKYKPDGNIFVSKSKYYHQLLPKNLEQGFTTNLVYSLNQNISKQIVSGIIELLMIRDLFIYTFISSLRYLGKNRTRKYQ